MAQDWISSKRPGEARPTIISYRSLIVIFFSSRTLVPEFLQTGHCSPMFYLLLFRPSTIFRLNPPWLLQSHKPARV